MVGFKWLQRAGTVDSRVLTSTRRELRMLALRMMELGLLQQFTIARKMVNAPGGLVTGRFLQQITSFSISGFTLKGHK